jgi:hypothetical protein
VERSAVFFSSNRRSGPPRPSPLSSRPELRRSIVERSAVFFSSNRRSGPPRPSPLSSRPKLRRSAVERSAVSAVLPWECFSTERTRISYFALLATSTCAVSVERAACRSSTPWVSTGNPGQRSGEICGVSGPFLEMFFNREVMGRWPAQGDEKAGERMVEAALCCPATTEPMLAGNDKGWRGACWESSCRTEIAPPEPPA